MLYAALEPKGTPIGELDTQVAAHALTLGVTLVPNDERHFSQVAGLQLEDWLKTSGRARGSLIYVDGKERPTHREARFGAPHAIIPTGGLVGPDMYPFRGYF